MSLFRFTFLGSRRIVSLWIVGTPLIIMMLLQPAVANTVLAIMSFPLPSLEVT